MNVEYIIVQAGGKGTRLGYLTQNKPKALVPIDNLPMLFHLFRKFPDKKFIIIADYKIDVLREYLSCFADVMYRIIDVGGTGTCSGVNTALKMVPENKPFMLVWSDLILPEKFNLPVEDYDYIGISETFPCRWSYRDGTFSETSSDEYGVAGLFIFRNKSKLSNVPSSGELVRWISQNNLTFKTIGLSGTREFGLLSEYEKLEPEKCRPFNRITSDGEVLIKEGIDSQGRKLAILENNWYKHAIENKITIIPKIYSTNPLRMEKIVGKNIYEYNLSYNEKQKILTSLSEALKMLHDSEKSPVDYFSVKEAYYTKTMDRLSKIRDLVPFADKPIITINNRPCRNVYFNKRLLEKKLDEIPCNEFSFIHGDCTFSNMMLKNDTKPVLIDPRGYFGFTDLYGDANYDWAKLYYSIIGNYDQFNLKRFKLDIGENNINLVINSNNWEDMENEFFNITKTNPYVIKLLHAVIWLSLTTYAWQDYDSICGAFYNGLYYLEEVL